MLYGYSKKVVDKKYNLLELSEITFALTPEMLRDLAAFVGECADEMEQSPKLSWGWHRHLGEDHKKLKKQLKGKRKVVALPPRYRQKDVVMPRPVVS